MITNALIIDMSVSWPHVKNYTHNSNKMLSLTLERGHGILLNIHSIKYIVLTGQIY